MCAMMTICNPGDKVMVFSPFYENYGADAILSGAEPIYIPLVPPELRVLICRLVEDGFRAGCEGNHRLQSLQSHAGRCSPEEELMQNRASWL